MHIAIAGNIGCGKTTLTRMLAEHYGWQPRYESVSDNPYLEDFYADMERWSFNLQIYFLNRRFKEVVEISQTDDIIVQDRTIFEDACIFAPNLHDQGMMSDRDFNNYKDLFDLMMSLVKLPDLMIYIDIEAQVHGKKRPLYEGRLLVIDGDNCKFGDNPEHFDQVINRIDGLLYGLFPIV